ncbi:MAG TPA: DHA2 family efflux MFS transporter permease subunit [Candidatus Paceibacterota bacterium]|nr:DHA2 family efflux MFS transporter permease subunit [Candidatus Paceibacterota bacterium]HPT18255.1 DHA2 family efflux MFS transporter permease subunit [Candidatus Paceibacterota bacterium]
MTEAKQDKLRWWVLITVIIGTFLSSMDQTVVNLALPKIIDEFNITVSAAGWIATAYIIANAIFVPIWGKLGDTIGRKKVYIIGFSVFVLGSILAGFAWDLKSMIVFRVIQAIAGSADYPTAMAIIAVTFKQGRERAQALGIWSSAFAAASVLGPLIGGPLIDSLGWRSVFFINLPIGIIGVLMALRFINESRSEEKPQHFDWWGAITLGVTLSSLVLVLEKGSSWGWLSISSIISYLVILIFGKIFIDVEHKAKEPIVDLSFFKIPAFVNIISNNFIIFMGMMGSVFLIPVFVQTFLGFSATESGYLFMPMALVMMITSPIGGMLTGRVKSKYVIFASTLISAFGLFLFSFLDPRSTVWGVIIPLSIMAFGMGLGMAQRTNLVTTIVKDSEIGIASSVLALARSISGAFGIALFGTILNNRIEHNVLQINNFSHLFSNSPIDLQQYISLIALKAQVTSYDFVFIVSSIVVALGSFTILALKEKDEKIDKKIQIAEA